MLKEKYKSFLVDSLARFVQIPSRSFPWGGEEGKLQELVAEMMTGLGLEVSKFEGSDIPGFLLHPMCYDRERNYRGRSLVIGKFGADGGDGLLVLAHSDTVPVDNPDDWSFDPFCGEVRDGKVMGLGSSDDKWGLAVMLTVIKALKEEEIKVPKNIIFASIVDEESGVGNGTLMLGLALKEMGVRVKEALYLDGSGMDVCIGGLGGSNLYLIPKEDILKDKIEEHYKKIRNVCKELSAERSFLFDREYYRDNSIREHNIILRKPRRGEGKGAVFKVSFYTLMGEDVEEFSRVLEERVFGVLGEDRELYDFYYRQPWFEPDLISADTRIVKCVSSAVSGVLGGLANVTTLSKQDRFVLVNHFGIPTVSFGPRSNFGLLQGGRGGAHQPDEMIEIDELWKGAQIAYRAVMDWFAEEQ